MGSNLKRINNLKWVEPTFPPRKKRVVRFSLMHGDDGIYFVNDSDETLSTVAGLTKGFYGDEDFTAPLENNVGKLIYKDVKQGESVWLDDFDPIGDSDFILGLTIYVESKKFGKLVISSKTAKGNIPAHPLMYEDGTSPMRVNIRDENS